MLDRIALDMDGVLYNWEDNLRRLVAEEFDEEVPPATSTWKMQWMQTHHWKWYHENPDKVFGEGAAFEGAVSHARDLLNLTRDLHIVTGGEPNSEEVKKAWLWKVGIEYDSFTLVPPHGARKVDAVLADLYIDDSPRVVDEVIQETMAGAVVVDRPYNHSDTIAEWPNPRIFRAVSWHAVVRIAAWYNEREEARASRTA